MTKASIEIIKREVEAKLNSSSYYNEDRLQLMQLAIQIGILEEQEKQTELLSRIEAKIMLLHVTS